MGTDINNPSKPPFKFLFVASARLYKFYLHRSRLNRNVDKGGNKFGQIFSGVDINVVEQKKAANLC